MKRHKLLLASMITLLSTAAVHAQQTSQEPKQDALKLISVIGAFQQQDPALQAPPQAPPPPLPPGARGRGQRSGAPATNDDLNMARERERALAIGNSVNTTVTNSRGLLVNPASGAWWTNAALMARLGLTDDQKLRIERAFENNRVNLTTTRDTLQKEETQLSRLLDAEPLDRGSVTTQIYKVVQARGDLEKVNALMTLEMREVLTRAQWMQLQVEQSVNVSVGVTTPGGRGGGRGGPRSGGPGTAPAGVVGGRGTQQ